MPAGKEHRFLICSSKEILGPYSKEEVIELIKNGSISIFDEVTEPYGIWQYLDSHKEFKKVIRSINVQTRLSNFLTRITDKMTTTGKTKDTKSKTEETIPLTEKEKALAKETTYNVVKLSKAQKKEVKSYISQKESQQRVRKKINRIVNIIWQAVFGIALLTIGFIGYQIFYLPIQERKQISQDFTEKGSKFYNFGWYEQALPYFEAAYSQGLLKSEDKLSFSTLLMHRNQIQRAIVVKKEISDKSVLEGNQGIMLDGLISFYDEEHSKAEKIFQDIISKSGNDDLAKAALVNLALLKWTVGQTQESSKSIDALLQKGFDRDVVWYLKALNFLTLNKLEELKTYLEEELALISDSPFVVEFKQELYLLLSYIYMKNNEIQKLKITVNKLLNEDPFLNENYKYDPLIYIQKLSWDHLRPYCKDISNYQKGDNLLQALYAFCLIKTSKLRQAEGVVKAVEKKEPQNPLFLSLYAYLLMSQAEAQEKVEQVFALINYGNLTKDQALPFILQAHFLEKKDLYTVALSVFSTLH